jgi:hypothetical protein
MAQHQPNTHNPPPTIPAYRENGQLVVRCPFCGTRHVHGAVGPQVGAGDGRRAAHCVADDSPFRQTGYILQEVRPVSRVFWVIAS